MAHSLIKQNKYKINNNYIKKKFYNKTVLKNINYIKKID